MFTPFDDPKGHFSFIPIPSKFFLEPSPFGPGAVLILKQFPKNGTAITVNHSIGIKLAIAQVISTFGLDQGNLEVYGITDRTGSEAVNMTVSAARARSVHAVVKASLGLSDFHASWNAGLGERFADEYYAEKDSTSDKNFRGVACYFWDLMPTARDPGLVVSIKFNKPPKGNSLLGPLYLGRYRSSPPSPFA